MTISKLIYLCASAACVDLYAHNHGGGIGDPLIDIILVVIRLLTLAVES